jgi:hypothetical protein
MKKYSEKYINAYKVLSQAIIGFEFEFYSNVSYYKTLEILNEYLKPVRIHGFKQYHPNFSPDENNFMLTPDISGGLMMAELVTGPMDYYQARYYLLNILKFIEEYGYTNDKSSLHINLSFKNNHLKDLNLLKHILSTNEERIWEIFPSRRNNIYAKSIKNIIPFDDYDFSSIDINMVKNLIRLPRDKYYGINYSHIDNIKSSRIEYRYIGGADYHKNSGEILDIMDEFIINTYNCIEGEFTNTDIRLLSNFLDKKINSFKTFNSYDKFLVDFPDIQIQIDQTGNYDIVNAYYNQIYKKLFKLVESTDNLKDGVVNYVTETKRLEVVGFNFTGTMNIKDFDFIDCDIKMQY